MVLVDLLINRTLVYASLSATLIVLYFGGIVVFRPRLAMVAPPYWRERRAS